jgi:uncharacterized protein YndB with AHSA1/START domain
MTTSDTSKIEKIILIRAPRSRVWRAITNAQEFSKWFGVEMAGTFAPGARLQMTTTHEEHKGIIFYVTVEQMEPEHTFSWRWHPGIPEPDVDYSTEPMTLVAFRLEEVENGTKVTLIESGFDRLSLARRAKAYEGNSQGWDMQMKSLERYVRESS